MLSPVRSRIRNLRRWINPTQDGISIRPIQLLLFVLAFSLILQDPRCLASSGTNESDRVSTSEANSSTDARDTAPLDAAARASSADDAAKAKAGEDALAFTGGSSAIAVKDLPSGTVNPDKNAIGPAHSRGCILFRESLCRAAKNRPLLSLAAAQTAALVSDGVTTRQFLGRGYVEVDPVARILIGRKPTWGRMVPLGAVQVFAGAWLGEQMAMSRHTWVRRLWWLPQAIGIAGNAAATAHNVSLR